MRGVVSKNQREGSSKDGQEEHQEEQNLQVICHPNVGDGDGDDGEDEHLLEAEESREKVATKTTVAEHKDTNWITLREKNFQLHFINQGVTSLRLLFAPESYGILIQGAARYSLTFSPLKSEAPEYGIFLNCHSVTMISIHPCLWTLKKWELG